MSSPSIAVAAREQSVGLAEVNTAVNQMDHVTQQNAAMVEESSAAGATLAAEAARLRQLIAGFKLGNADPAGHQVAALREAGAALATADRGNRRPAAPSAKRAANGASQLQVWAEF
jgi:methyl-accepting chemotaxis protein